MMEQDQVLDQPDPQVLPEGVAEVVDQAAAVVEVPEGQAQAQALAQAQAQAQAQVQADLEANRLRYQALVSRAGVEAMDHSLPSSLSLLVVAEFSFVLTHPTF